MVKQLKRVSGLLLVVLMLPLFVAACGSTSSANSAQKVTNGYTSPLADYFPAETSVYITVNTNADSDQAKSFKKIADYLSGIPEVKKLFDNIDIVKAGQLGTYDTDVKPWLNGELALGLTDLKGLLSLASMASNTGSNSQSTPDLSGINKALNSFLIGATIKDQAKAEAFLGNALKKALGSSNIPAQTSTYNGYNLTSYNLFIVELTFATNKDRLFVGTSTAVKAAIDRAKDKSLTNAANFKTVSGKLPAQNLTFVYADLGAIFKTILNDPQIQKSLQAQPDTFKGLDYYGAVGLSFATADEGFRVDAYTTYDESKIPANQKAVFGSANASKIIEALPEKTFFFANGQNAKAIYDYFISNLNTMGAQSDSIKEGISDFEQQSGLSIEKDIAALLGGEFVAFTTPVATNGKAEATPFAIGLLAAAPDKAVTQSKLDRIVSSIQANSNGEVTFVSKTFGGVTYKSAALPDTDMTLNVGIAGNNLFLSSSTTQAEALITAGGGTATFSKSAAAKEFELVKGYLPTDNQGYFFLNIQDTINVALSALPANKQAEVKQVTDKLTKLISIGAATKNTTKEGVVTVFIHFPVTK